jgi:hypothetical protein
LFRRASFDSGVHALIVTGVDPVIHAELRLLQASHDALKPSYAARIAGSSPAAILKFSDCGLGRRDRAHCHQASCLLKLRSTATQAARACLQDAARKDDKCFREYFR